MQRMSSDLHLSHSKMALSCVKLWLNDKILDCYELASLRVTRCWASWEGGLRLCRCWVRCLQSGDLEGFLLAASLYVHVGGRWRFLDLFKKKWAFQCCSAVTSTIRFLSHACKSHCWISVHLAIRMVANDSWPWMPIPFALGKNTTIIPPWRNLPFERCFEGRIRLEQTWVIQLVVTESSYGEGMAPCDGDGNMMHEG